MKKVFEEFLRQTRFDNLLTAIKGENMYSICVSKNEKHVFPIQ